MRVSPLKHTLAVLRILVGLTQKEMAAILHCSAPTIQAIELGKLNLSEKLAGLVSLQTGINLAWLLKNDVNQPPIDIKGKAYTKETFEEFQAVNHIRQTPTMENEVAIYYQEKFIERLHALLIRAYINDDTDLCVYKLSKVFDELEKQFHVTEADRNAIYLNKRPNLEADAKKDNPLSWIECISGFYDVLDLEEKKKIAARGLKLYSEAELKEQNIQSVYLDDNGQLIVNRLSQSKPINLKPKSKNKK